MTRRSDSSGMRAGADQIQTGDILASIVRAEPGALQEHRLQTECRSLPRTQSIRKSSGVIRRDVTTCFPGPAARLPIDVPRSPAGNARRRSSSLCNRHRSDRRQGWHRGQTRMHRNRGAPGMDQSPSGDAGRGKSRQPALCVRICRAAIRGSAGQARSLVCNRVVTFVGAEIPQEQSHRVTCPLQLAISPAPACFGGSNFP